MRAHGFKHSTAGPVTKALSRRVAGPVAVLAISVAAAACGSTSASPTTSGSGAAATATPASANLLGAKYDTTTPSSVTLTGAGANSIEPFFESVFYQYNQKNSNTTVNYSPAGSSVGVTDIQQGTVQFGDSEIPMTASQLTAATGGAILQIPEMCIRDSGYTVHDLGKQVPLTTIVEKAIEVDADVIGLSALLVSTSKQMPMMVEELDHRGLGYPVIIGGAAINRGFGRRILYLDPERVYEPGVFYCKDAFEGLETCDQLVDPERRAPLVDRVRAEAQTFRDQERAKAAAKAELPKVVVSARSDTRTDAPIPTPPFWGPQVVTGISTQAVYPHIDRNSLFKMSWQFRGVHDPERWDELVRTELEPDVYKRQLDDLSRGRRSQVPSAARFLQADVTEELGGVLGEVRPEIVFHEAAQIDVRRSLAEPLLDTRINVLGTVNLLQACAAAGVRRVVFASSGGAIYGDTDAIPTPESHPQRPASNYGAAKAAAELYGGVYSHVYGVEFVALRYANVYGPRQDPHGEAGVIAIFTERMLGGEVPTINGDGTQTLSLIHILRSSTPTSTT